MTPVKIRQAVVGHVDQQIRKVVLHPLVDCIHREVSGELLDPISEGVRRPVEIQLWSGVGMRIEDYLRAER